MSRRATWEVPGNGKERYQTEMVRGRRLRPVQLVLLGWALVSFLVALSPAGTGGLPRVLDEVVFLTLGPGCALMVLLCRTLPPPVAGVLSIAASLTVLVLSSMLLLVVGGWTVWGVAALVTAATAVFTLVPSGMWRS
jgi:hypothetical protein